MSYEIMLKRVYAPLEDRDGVRVLVDRLWLCGKPRNTLALDKWCWRVVPSPKLRRHYHQQKMSHAVFTTRSELRCQSDKFK